MLPVHHDQAPVEYRLHAATGGTDVHVEESTWWIDPVVGVRFGADLTDTVSVVLAGNVDGHFLAQIINADLAETNCTCVDALGVQIIFADVVHTFGVGDNLINIAIGPLWRAPQEGCCRPQR